MKRYQTRITREDLRKNPDIIYLFGDNLKEIGYGGQAKEMRGEPNAIGIPTKKLPTMDNDAFFTDDELELNKRYISEAFEKIPSGKVVVIPSAGLGTGLAQLDIRAPKTYAFLLDCLSALK
jgi:hypothetical protein